MSRAAARHRSLAWAAGALAGLTLVALTLPGLRMTAAQTIPAAEVGVRAAGSAELAVTGADPIAAGHLEPGAMLSGTFALRNETGEILALRAGATADDPQADRGLRLRVSGDRTLVGAGSPRKLADGPPSLWLAPGGSVALRVEAWIDPGAAAALGGRRIEVALTFPAVVVGR